MFLGTASHQLVWNYFYLLKIDSVLFFFFSFAGTNSYRQSSVIRHRFTCNIAPYAVKVFGYAVDILGVISENLAKRG